jgi:hypothetical protein
MEKKLVNRHITYEEHISFLPVFDELAIYAKTSLH